MEGKFSKNEFKTEDMTPLSIPEVFYLMKNVDDKRKGKVNNNPYNYVK